MLRSVFSALGVILFALLLFSASFLGNVAAGIERDRQNYETFAIETTRALSLSWKTSDINELYAADAQQEPFSSLTAHLESAGALGPLVRTEAVSTLPRWAEPSSRPFMTVSKLADRLAALIGRSVRVTFIGQFAGGRARIMADLKREDGTIRLWRLYIESQDVPRMPRQPDRRIISHA